MVNKSDISFVVQGPVDKETGMTDRVLKSIREFFPESCIILSTWEGSDVSKLSFDHVIFNGDPGGPNAYYLDRKHIKNNNNRQIVSSLHGLKVANTPFAVKTRTDIAFSSDKLTEKLSHIQPCSGTTPLFKKQLVTVANLSVNPRKTHPMPFHPSDFFYAGLSCDLVDYFDIPLMTEKDTLWNQDGHIDHPGKAPKLIAQFANEQYILLQHMYKKGLVPKIKHATDNTIENILLTEEILGTQFRLLSHQNLGINSLKYPIKYYTSSVHTYTECEWKQLAARYSGKTCNCINFEYGFNLLVEWTKCLLRDRSENLYTKVKKLSLS